MHLRLSRIGSWAAAASLLLAVGVEGAGPSAAASVPFTMESTAGGWAPNGSINPLAHAAAFFGPLQLLPLAYYEEGTGKFFPELASSWSLHGHTLVVHLRPDARWSTGKPVTSADVKTSILLGDLGYGPNAAGAGQVDRIETPNSHTVVMNIPYPGTFTEKYVLGITVLPSSIFGPYVLDYVQTLAQEAATNPNAAQTLSSAYAVVAGFNLKSLPSNGPYILSKVTSDAALLVKNPYFFDASKVKVNEIEVLNVLNAAASTTDLESGQVDFNTNTEPGPVMQQWQSQPGHGIVMPPNAQTAIFFNAKDYPWNLVQVRQAMAYLINRTLVTRISTPPGFQPANVEAGHPSAFLREWLTPKQMASLNRYPYNPSKGLALLRAAGFRRTPSGWVMPNGKPFDVPIAVDASFNTWVLAGNAIAQELRQVGIHAEENAVNGAVYFHDAAVEGSFPVFFDFSSVVDSHPVASWALQSWPVLTGYSMVSGNMVKSLPGLGYPVSMKVPGVGTVNTNEVLETLLTNGNTAVQKKLDYTFARLMEYELPYITLWTKYEPIMYSSQRYTGWPPSSDPIWVDVPLDENMGLVILLQTGRIYPVK